MKVLGVASFFLIFTTANAEVQLKATKDEGPPFIMGKETLPNVYFLSDKQPELGIHAGVRYQATAEVEEIKGDKSFDAYGRRVRFEFGVKLSSDTSFKMDIRNDRTNFTDKGEGNFSVGDAFINSKKLAGLSWLNFKGFRTKVDVSRTETVSSAALIVYDRAKIADEAAQYVNHNRRAMNYQLYGDFDKKVHYSLAVGDGVHSETFEDALGHSASSIIKQNPMIGGKVVFSPFDGWEETKRTETYFGEGQHFAVGAGYFATSNIQFATAIGGEVEEVDRSLLNVEMTSHIGPWFFGAEYFAFDNMIKNFNAAQLEYGHSSGWYAQTEYVFSNWSYIAPFVRISVWDKFESEDEFILKGRVVGINWYLRGNTLKVGFNAYSETTGEALGNEEVLAYRLTTQLHF